MKGSAAAVRTALKREKQRFDASEATKFSNFKVNAAETESHHRMPRTFANKTFFTPHLQRIGSAAPKDSLSREYAVLFDLHGQPKVSLTPYNPAREISELPALEPPALAKVHQLENLGYRFCGKNRNILVFERLYNPRQVAMQKVQRIFLWATTGVAVVTSALFIGEYFALEYDKQPDGLSDEQTSNVHSRGKQ